MSLQATLNAYVDHGSSNQGLKLHTSAKDIPNAALQSTKQTSSPSNPSGEHSTMPRKQKKAASPKGAPGSSTLARRPIVNPLGLGSSGQLPGPYSSENHYAEITVKPRTSPSTVMTPTITHSATLPRNATLPTIHPNELDEDYVEMKRPCALDMGREGRGHMDPLPSPSPSLRAVDPYTRALIEENKRLRSSLTHFTEKVTSLERDKAELEEKVQKLEAELSSKMMSSQDGTVRMVGNSPVRVPVPEALPQSQQQQEETRECNLSYLSNLDDDQVREGEGRG